MSCAVVGPRGAVKSQEGRPAAGDESRAELSAARRTQGINHVIVNVVVLYRLSFLKMNCDCDCDCDCIALIMYKYGP